jgi:hypothetical protein
VLETGKIRRMAEGNLPMLPIMDPGYNLREMAKQLVLLEDHLFQEAKRCPDCIRKHFLTVEALLEEAVTLDESGDLAEQVPEVVDWIRELQGEWLDGTNPAEIAQALRGLRKQVSEDVFDVRELQAAHVATRHASGTFTVYGSEYPDDGPHAKLMAQYMPPPDDKYSKEKWDLYRDWAKKRRVSKDDMEALLDAFDNGAAHYILRGPARKPKDLDEIAQRLQIKVGTRHAVEVAEFDKDRFVAGFFSKHSKLSKYKGVRVVITSGGGRSGHGQASQEGGKILLHPGFWKLNQAARNQVFAHELGHLALESFGYSKMLKVAEALEVDVWDSVSLPFGQSNGEEAFADSFGSYFTDGEVQQRHPEWAKIVEAVHAKARGATKSTAEREDEEVERLVRRSPSKKPPRHDLRRERIRVDEDPDIEDLGQDGDKDISRNFKRIGSALISSVIRLHHRQLVMGVVRRGGSHAPGDTWQADSGGWYGMSPAGTTQGFEEDQEAAKAFASGGDEDAPEDEGSGSGGGEGPDREELEKELAENAGNAHESMSEAGLPEAFDQAIAGLDAAGNVEMGAAYAETRDSLVGGTLSPSDAEKALSETYTGSDPAKLGAALATAEYAKKVTLNPLMAGGPMSPPGGGTPPSPDQISRRTTESFENAKGMSSDQRKEQAEGLVDELKGLDEGTARHAEAKAALQGIQLAAIADGVSDDDFPGGDPPPQAFQAMVRVMANQPGGLALLTAPSEKMYDPEHRALLQQSMNGLSDADFMEVMGGSDSGPGAIAEMLGDAEDPAMRRQLREMAMEWHMDEASILSAIIREQDPDATPQEVTDQLREAEGDQDELERRINEGYEDDGGDEVLRIIEEARRQQVENIRGEDATGPASANADAFLEDGDRSQLLTGTDPPLPSPL